MSQHGPSPSPYPTFISSDRALARTVVRPIQHFIHLEVSGGIILLIATAAALIWVNSPFGESYHHLWETEIELAIGSWHPFAHGDHLGISIEALVNDALMAVFFFVVGLEIKRELVVGELRNPRSAAVPALAAVGGMVVPALVYLAFNLGSGASHGWGIPMATDIAFALGVVALLGSRVPATLKIFLLTLAIVDDIGAIAVIAIFYTSSLSLIWLAAAGAGLLLVAVLKQAKVWYVPVYAVIGTFVWFATFQSGVHATIAGVALGLMAPARSLIGRHRAERIADELEHRDLTADEVRVQAFRLKESVSVAERLENLLHPYTSYLIIPIFALANAGIELSGEVVSEAATAPATLGVIAGLVIGKPVGIVLFTWISTRLGLNLPRGATWGQVLAIGTAAGIGFTVSIFITGLAFERELLQEEAKIGILVASFLAAVASLLLLWRSTSPVAAVGDSADGAPLPPDAVDRLRADGGVAGTGSTAPEPSPAHTQ